MRGLSCALLVAAAVASAAGRGSDEAGPPDERSPHERIDLPSIAACGRCHQQVYEEWSRSLHAGAWTNANVQNATQGFERESCRPCHSPEPVFATGLDRAPEYRDFNQADGVHCLSCHGLEDGVAAARTIEGAPCRPRFEPRLQLAEHCYPCHEPTHQAFEEYYASDAFAVGVRCVDCHMPPRAAGDGGQATRGGRSHGPHGGLSADFVRRALAWSCALEEGRVVVELRNRTGHKFPGEIPSRAFLVEVSFDGEPGETLLLRKPHRNEQRADDRLRPDETRVLEFPLPAGASRATVRLLFQPLPLLPAEAAFVLGEWSSP